MFSPRRMSSSHADHHAWTARRMRWVIANRENGFAMYYPPAFDDASREAIEKHVPEKKRIAISEEDALAFACNAVNIDDVVVVNRATSAFVKTLGKAGFDVVQSPLSEFMKAGGSAKCLTLRLDEP